MGTTSASSLTLAEITAPCPPHTLSILAPSVVTSTTEQQTAHVTELHSVLYKHVTPYIPLTWDSALRIANLKHVFPLLVHHLTYGSPISKMPPLVSTFIPKNLPLATVLHRVGEFGGMQKHRMRWNQTAYFICRKSPVEQDDYELGSSLSLIIRMQKHT